MTKTTYSTTLPDGRVVTRTSARAYTHVVVLWKAPDRPVVCAWASSETLATKRAETTRRRWPGHRVEIFNSVTKI